MKKLTLLLMCFVMALVANSQDIILNATFEDCTGTGGNDGTWSGNTVSGAIPSSYTDAGWTFVKGTLASQCLKFGTGSLKGSVETPMLAGIAGFDGVLTFRAGAWNGKNEKLGLYIYLDGSVIDSVTMVKASFQDYTVNFTGATNSSKIKIESQVDGNNRFFIDDIKVVKVASSTEEPDTTGTSTEDPDTTGTTTEDPDTTGSVTTNPYGLDASSPVGYLFEDFEKSSMPSDWKNVAVQGDRVWELKSYSGNSYAQMSANKGTGDFQVLLISPAINFDTIQKSQISFEWKSGYTNGATLKVYVMQEDGTKTEVKSINDNANPSAYGTDFNAETLDLSAYSGVKFLAFEYNGNTNLTTTYQIDNVNVPSKGPSVLVDKMSLMFENVVLNATSTAQTVIVTAANLTSAPVATIEGADAALFAQTGTLTTDGGTISVTFTPDSEGTKTATLKITAGDIVKEVSLTGVAVSASNPYNLDDSNPLNALNEDFEGGAMPEGWKTVMLQGDKNWTYNTYSENSYVQLNGHQGNGVLQTLLISPAVNIDALSNKALSFQWKSGYTNGAELKVYLMSKDGQMDEIKSIIDQGVSVWGNSFNDEYVDLSSYSGVKFLAFEYNGEGGVATTAYQVDNVNMPGINTSVALVENTLQAYAADGKIYFSATADDNVSVFSLTGQTILSTVAKDGLNELSINYQGVVIVKVGSKFAKVIL